MPRTDDLRYTAKFLPGDFVFPRRFLAADSRGSFSNIQRLVEKPMQVLKVHLEILSHDIALEYVICGNHLDDYHTYPADTLMPENDFRAAVKILSDGENGNSAKIQIPATMFGSTDAITALKQGLCETIIADSKKIKADRDATTDPLFSTAYKTD